LLFYDSFRFGPRHDCRVRCWTRASARAFRTIARPLPHGADGHPKSPSLDVPETHTHTRTRTHAHTLSPSAVPLTNVDDVGVPGHPNDGRSDVRVSGPVVLVQRPTPVRTLIRTSRCAQPFGAIVFKLGRIQCFSDVWSNLLSPRVRSPWLNELLNTFIMPLPSLLSFQPYLVVSKIHAIQNVSIRFIDMSVRSINDL